MPGSLTRKHSRLRGEKSSARGTSADVQPCSSPRKWTEPATPSSRSCSSSAAGAGCCSALPKTRYQRLIGPSAAHLTDRSRCWRAGGEPLLAGAWSSGAEQTLDCLRGFGEGLDGIGGREHAAREQAGDLVQQRQDSGQRLRLRRLLRELADQRTRGVQIEGPAQVGAAGKLLVDVLLHEPGERVRQVARLTALLGLARQFGPLRVEEQRGRLRRLERDDAGLHLSAA